MTTSHSQSQGHSVTCGFANLFPAHPFVLSGVPLCALPLGSMERFGRRVLPPLRRGALRSATGRPSLRRVSLGDLQCRRGAAGHGRMGGFQRVGVVICAAMMHLTGPSGFEAGL